MNGDQTKRTRDEQKSQRGSGSVSAFVHLGAVYVIWGSTYLAIRLAVRGDAGFPPFLLGVFRLALAGTVLLGWARLRGLRVRLSRSDALTLLAAGILMWPLANGLVNFAEQRADSSYAALLLGSLPIWTAVIEAISHRRRPSWFLGLSLLVGFGGLGLLTAPRLAVAGAADVLSIAALIVAPVSWALGSVLQIRRPVAVSPLVTAGYLHVFGCVGFVVLSVATKETWQTPAAEAWGALGYLVLAGSVVAFTSYVRVLHLLPTSVVMTYAYVNPVIAVLLGWAMLGETVNGTILVGMGMILVGVWGVFHDRYRRRVPADLDSPSSKT